MHESNTQAITHTDTEMVNPLLALGEILQICLKTVKILLLLLFYFSVFIPTLTAPPVEHLRRRTLPADQSGPATA